jgi:GxxExxY protein
MEELLYKNLTYKIRGACFEVYNKFGGSFKEKIIDNALAVAFRKKQLFIERQKRISLYFENQKVGVYVPDYIIENKILIELKCKPSLFFQDKKQFWQYLKASDYKLGMLINFSPTKLVIMRRIYDKVRHQRKSAYKSA